MNVQTLTNKIKRITNLQGAHNDVRYRQLFDTSMFKLEVYLRDHWRHTLQMTTSERNLRTNGNSITKNTVIKTEYDGQITENE